MLLVRACIYGGVKTGSVVISVVVCAGSDPIERESEAMATLAERESKAKLTLGYCVLVSVRYSFCFVSF